MIEATGIVKKFGKKTVLDSVHLAVEKGTAYGLIGYNGAGKTTLLKLLCGIYRPDRGTVTVDGISVFENEPVKKRMFMMAEEPYFLPQASLYDMEKFYKGYYVNWSHKDFQILLSWFRLPEKKKVSSFSKGMKRKAALAAAFSSGSSYLFLDEAFDGLDMEMRSLVRKILRQYVQKKQAAVFLSSHNLAELEQCAERFGMIQNGKLLKDCSVEQLAKQGVSLEQYFLEKNEERRYDWTELF